MSHASKIRWKTFLKGLIMLSRRLLGLGCLRWVSGKPSIHITQPTLLEPQGAVTPGSNHLRRGCVYRLVPEAPYLMRMQIGPEAPHLTRMQTGLEAPHLTRMHTGHFLSRRAYQSYSPVPGPTLEMVLCRTHLFGEWVLRIANVLTKSVVS